MSLLNGLNSIFISYLKSLNETKYLYRIDFFQPTKVFIEMWTLWKTCIEEGMEVGNENGCSSEIEQDNSGDPMDSGKFKNFS